MSSAHKKVIVRRITNETFPGYLPLAGFVHGGSVPLLDLEGRVVSINLSDIKHICYVRDFNLGDAANPERLTRRTFLARPRAEGLWVRMTFRGGDLLEGLAPTDVSVADDMIRDAGIFVTPPDTRSNTQRIYVPRIALAELQLVAVITTPSRRKPVPAPLPSLQEDLFDSIVPPNTRPN